jgi:hypothetical protein
MNIQIGKIYQHYKGDNYKVFAIGQHTETEEKHVLYHKADKNLSEAQIWVRPINMFFEEVEYNGAVVKRFTLVEELA